MKEIQEAVRACLEARSGIKTVSDRARCREYPLLAVSVQEGGTVLLDGGRQAEHRYQITVTAVSGRDREENTALLSSLVSPLLRGVPLEAEDRVLHPLDIRTEGEELAFTVSICRPLPEAEGERPDWMRRIQVDVH